MSSIAIVYFSQFGSTASLAESIASGVRSVAGAEAALMRVVGEQIVGGRWEDKDMLDRLSAADAIIFGSPTFMGGVAAQFKAFADATASIWYHRGWKDKLAGGFTVSGSPSGDKLQSLVYLNVFAAQHGMIWVNWDELPRQEDGTNRLGGFMGLMAQNPIPPGQPLTIDPADAMSAEKYGRRIVTVARSLVVAAE